MVAEKELSVSRKQAQAAFETLAAYGRQQWSPTSNPSKGQCLGVGLSAFTTHNVVIDASVAALEDWNCHLMGAALRALAYGAQNDHRRNYNNGSWTRNSRWLKIRLPKWWS